MSEYIIEMNHIRKEFPGIVANDDITLQLKKGEIHALLGENGAVPCRKTLSSNNRLKKAVPHQRAQRLMLPSVTEKAKKWLKCRI